jgi:hypothetical protein
MKKRGIREIEIMISQRDIQVAYNVNLNLQVLLILNDEGEYNVFFIQDEKVIKSLVMGFSNKLAYYNVKDIAAQYPHLPQDFLLYNKN